MYDVNSIPCSFQCYEVQIQSHRKNGPESESHYIIETIAKINTEYSPHQDGNRRKEQVAML